MAIASPPHAVARRRKNNREAMQRLRDRQQRAIEELRATAHALAAAHAALRQQIDDQAADQAAGPTRKLRDARAQTLALVTKNARFQQDVDERIRWEDHVALLLEYLQRERPPLDEHRRNETAPFDLGVAFKRQWLRATRPPFTSEFFGWTIQYFPQHSYWYHRFTKRFRGLSAGEVSQRAWRNAQRLTSYRTRLPVQRVVQRINDNAFVLARWVGCDGAREGRVLFLLRFRVEEPDGTIVIGMLTLPKPGEDTAVDEIVDDGDAARAGDDVCLCVKLNPWHDKGSDSEHCTAEFSGCMPFGEPDNEQLNALEMVFSLSRWEEANAASAARVGLSR